MTKQFIARHRLKKKDPTAAVSEPVEADRLLRRSRARRSRFASALVEGARWWNQAFERRRLSQRLPGEDAARRRQLAGHPLQRHQLGAPVDARLEHRRQRDRSAHRRDHQGRRHARLAARSPGLPDRRRTARALQDRRRDTAGTARVGDRAHPPAGGARSRPHARPRPQLLRQRRRPHLGDGLSAPAGHAEGGRHARLLEGLRRRHRRVGQGRDQPTATRTSPPAADEANAAAADPRRRRGRRTCAT